MKKERKRPPSYRALRLRLGIFALALWLGAMGILTWTVAADMQHQLKAQVRELVSFYGHTSSTISDRPVNQKLMSRLGRPYSYISFEPLLPFVLPHRTSISSHDSLWGRWDLYYGFEAAEVFQETAQPHNVAVKTESTVTFAWFSEASWQSMDSSAAGHGYIHPPEELKDIFSDFPMLLHSSMLFDALRMRGHFLGDRFIPTSIDSGSVTYEGLDPGSDRTPQLLMELDSRKRISWHSQYSAEEAPGSVTIYCTDVRSYLSPLRPIEVGGQTYAGITDAWLAGEFTQSDSLLCTQYSYTGRTAEGEQSFLYTVLIRAWPLEYAVRRLWPAYLVSAFLVLVGVWVFSWRIRRSLTTPLAQLTAYDLADVEHAWAEPYALQDTLTQLRQSLAETSTRLSQTQTALNYAAGAEESRRRLVSSIAHELKTPLAVIHSYAEALQSNIAPQRQEHYISVIQTEAERMDAMVLEMLELSRLEAGKVRLSTDRVALLPLVKSVQQKLSPLAEAKQIRFTYPLAQEVTVLADEARLEQVLTNLMGNAIKYSPNGAAVCLKLFRDGSSVRFKITNPAPHLSVEAPDKVWDGFYRADPARSEPGTGLGLALVKTILELHRGKYAVRNVELYEEDVLPTGVEFSFSLPTE